MLEDLGGGSVAIGLGIRVTQMDVKEGPLCMLPEAVGEDVTPGFVTKVGATIGWVLLVVASTHVAAIENGGLNGDSSAGEGEGAEVGPFVPGIIMTNGDEVAFLAVEPMLNCKALVTAIAAVGQG